MLKKLFALKMRWIDEIDIDPAEMNDPGTGDEDEGEPEQGVNGNESPDPDEELRNPRPPAPLALGATQLINCAYIARNRNYYKLGLRSNYGFDPGVITCL